MATRLGYLLESGGRRRPGNALIRTASAAIVVAFWLALPASAQLQTIDAIDRGWYNERGDHDDSNNNTFTGRSGRLLYNSFFTFNLIGLERVSAGTLRLELESYHGSDPSEDFTVFDVVTGVPRLNRSNSGQIDIFDDLESGSVYGAGTAAGDDAGTVLEIPLSNAAIADINAAAGGLFALFAVGVHVDQITGSFNSEGLRWSGDEEPRTHQLVLEIANCFVVDAIDDQFSVINDGTTADFSVLANDECNGDTPISVVVQPGDLQPDRGGSAATNGAKVNYTPAAGFVGFEEFTYSAQDAGLDGGDDPPTLDQDTARVVVIVLEDIVPDAVDDVATTLQFQATIIDVLTNDSLGNGPTNDVTIETAPTNGSATLQADYTIRYVPNFNFFGEDSFEYRLTDANGDLDVATVTVGVSFVRGQVSIDIKPNDADNRINLTAGPGGGFEVAILSVGELFDAPGQIDPLSLKFGPRQANIWGAPRIRDSDGDGDDDLVVKFLTQQTGIACGDTSASLSGHTFESQSISGSDSTHTVNCPRVRKRH